MYNLNCKVIDKVLWVDENTNLVKGSYNIDKLVFTFSGEIWEDSTKTVILNNNGTQYTKSIINNECTIPAEIYKNTGFLDIGVFGTVSDSSNTITNRITTNFIRKFIRNGADSGIEPVGDDRADWNQNDETANSYVRNRTHWTGTSQTEIWNKTGLLINSGSVDISPVEFILNNNFSYNVTINNITYSNITCKSYNDFYYLGNLSKSGEGEDTGEIYLIRYYPSTKNTINIANGTYTISIEENSTVVHQIDKKYLPLSTLNDAGIVKPDGTTITIDANGTISSLSGVTEKEGTSENPIIINELSLGAYILSGVSKNTRFNPNTISISKGVYILVKGSSCNVIYEHDPSKRQVHYITYSKDSVTDTPVEATEVFITNQNIETYVGSVTIDAGSW